MITARPLLIPNIIAFPANPSTTWPSTANASAAEAILTSKVTTATQFRPLVPSGSLKMGRARSASPPPTLPQTPPMESVQAIVTLLVVRGSTYRGRPATTCPKTVAFSARARANALLVRTLPTN